MRKRLASVGEAREAICWDAVTREAVVLWTMRWARSSKTVDCRGLSVLDLVTQGLGERRTLTSR